ncbi:hypothetical protein ACQ4PT_017290 [Festuca glaucescens]
MPASGTGSPGRAPPPVEEEEPGRPHEALDLGLSLGVGAAALPVVQVSSASSGEEEEEAGGDEEAEGPSLPSCPVCMNPWTAEGEHRCPQCGKIFRQKHIINLYAPEIVVPNNDLEKQVLSLRHKNDTLENQNEYFLDGARVMGIDASSQIILASGRAAGVSIEHVLTKINMFSGHQTKVHLPPNTKALKDICIIPGGLAVFASLGKKLSLLRPNLLTGMESQGVCISLACAAPSSDLIVATFRPKVELSVDGTSSQVAISQSPTLSSSGKLGCHALMRRASSTSFVKEQTCNGNVSELRMSKSAIIPCSGNSQHLFAYGDESLSGVRTWQLPSFQAFTDLRPHRRPILDLRFAESSTGEKYLGCLSEEKLQVFRVIDH